MTSPTPKGEKMTLPQIANKFLAFLDKEHPAPSSRWLNLVRLMEGIEDAARAEALTGLSFKEDVEWHAAMKQGYAKGFADAVEKAAWIADDILGNGDMVGREIRALRPTGSGEEKLK